MEGFAGELSFMASSAGQAFLLLMEPHRLMFLGLGCIMGLVLGIVPGIGGLAGTAMLLPFTFTMDPYSAFALLLGLGSTTATGDPIPAVLFGVPGGAASAATVLDGHPDGQAWRGGARAQRRVHVLADGRHFRRGSARNLDSHPAPGDALPGFSGTARLFHSRNFHGRTCCPATRRCAAWPPAASAS